MRFRAPHESQSPELFALLGRAFPEASKGDLHKVIGSGLVHLDGRITRNPRRRIEPDAVISREGELEWDSDFGVPDASELYRAAGLVVVDRPLGFPGRRTPDDDMDPVAFLADVLGLDRSTFRPLWDVPSNAMGPWICVGTDERAEDVFEQLANDELATWWTAIVPTFGLPTGEFEVDGVHVSYATARRDGGLAELQLKPTFSDADAARDGWNLLCEALAAQGAPIVGDRNRGGYMAEGAMRLQLMSIYDESGNVSAGWTTPKGWWPDEPIAPAIEAASDDAKPKAIVRFRVSEKTLEVLGRGHLWALRDRDSDDPRGQEGALVQLQSPSGALGPYALADGANDVWARVWAPAHDHEAATDFRGEVELRVDDAMADRDALFRNLSETDLFRVIHAEGDRLPGLLVDRVGPLYRATLTGRAALRFRHHVYDQIVDLDPDAMIIEVSHTEDVRSRGTLPQATIVAEGARYVKPGDRVIGREDGLRYWCEPWEGIDVGFFADQRDNRRWAAAEATEGSRWLNLFCHTGAYTVALVAAGAEVVSVDLSRRYLDWLDDNLRLNGLPLDANTNAAEDARTYVRGDDTTYDGIIVDPPTAASGEDGFWSVHKDYEDLLVACIERLAPGGVMLVCRNARKRKPSIEELVQAAARRAGREIAGLEAGPPSADYPRVPGFPEGDSFEGLRIRFD